jgi:hypothetical protein
VLGLVEVAVLIFVNDRSLALQFLWRILGSSPARNCPREGG